MTREPDSQQLSLVTWIRSEILLLLACGVGMILRLHQYSRQIPASDEWHALRVLTEKDYAWILSNFGITDYCIPLTVFYKFLAGIGLLNEWSFRSPQLLCGIGALVVLPLMVRSHVGRRTANSFALLMAISPLLIYFSRYARPYGIAVFLALTGILSFYKWWTGQGRRWGLIYCCCAITTPYFLLPFLPFVFGPIPFALGELLFKKRTERPSLKALVVVGSISFAGLILLLAPALINDLSSLQGKLNTNEPTLSKIGDAGLLFAGSPYPLIAVLCSVIAAIGVSALLRTRTHLALFLLFIALCQIAGVLITGVFGLEQAIVLARYNLAALPVALLFLGKGIAVIEWFIQESLQLKLPNGLTASVFTGFLFLCGPIPDIYYQPNNWTNHGAFQYFPDPKANPLASRLTPKRIPEFYHVLGSEPAGSLVIVEVPWHSESWGNHLHAYQKVHRQWIRLGLVGDLYPPSKKLPELPRGYPGIRFNSFVDLSDEEALERAKVRYIVLHRHLMDELRGPQMTSSLDMTPCIEWCRERYGAPVFEDEFIVVFDRAQ